MRSGSGMAELQIAEETRRAHQRLIPTSSSASINLIPSLNRRPLRTSAEEDNQRGIHICGAARLIFFLDILRFDDGHTSSLSGQLAGFGRSPISSQSTGSLNPWPFNGFKERTWLEIRTRCTCFLPFRLGYSPPTRVQLTSPRFFHFRTSPFSLQ